MAAEETGFLKNVVSAFTLVTAWVFVTGWTYLHAFYSYFGININSLDFPFHHYLIFCYTQFTASIWSGLVMATLLIGFFLLTWAGVSTTRLRLALAVSCGYLLVFWAGFQLAIHNAEHSAVSLMGPSSSLPKIMLETKEIKYQYAAIEEVLSSSDLRLLLETKDQLFVFQPVDTSSPFVKVRVVALDRKDVEPYMRITIVNTNN